MSGVSASKHRTHAYRCQSGMIRCHLLFHSSLLNLNLISRPDKVTMPSLNQHQPSCFNTESIMNLVQVPEHPFVLSCYFVDNINTGCHIKQLSKMSFISDPWLPGIQLNLCLSVWTEAAPSYVTDMLHKKPLHTRKTRSSSYTMPLLNRPALSKATLGDRSFSFASSFVWNSIPNDVRCAPSLSSFKFRSVYKD